MGAALVGAFVSVPHSGQRSVPGVRTRTDVLHGVYVGSSFGPGPGAAAWDPNGRLVPALVNIKTTSAGQSVGGVTYAGSSQAQPMLFFVKP